MISKVLVTAFFLVSTMLLLTGEVAAAVRAHVGVHIGYRPVYTPASRYRLTAHRYRGPRVVRVERVRYGSIDFNIRPQKSQIYIDGKLLGIADDFNGYPQTARLPAGRYNIRVVAPNGHVERRRVYVVAGRELNFNLKF